jgi:glycosyltransferase involved in cell wall biosynthesis
MNILILTKTFPSVENSWGGIFVREQAEALSAEHQITVVRFTNNRNKFNPFFDYSVTEERPERYRLFSINVSRSFPVYNQFNYIVSLRLAMKRIIRETDPDLIHCHYSYPAGVVAMLIKMKRGIPYVITEHTRIRSTFRSVFHKWLSLKALRHSAINITVSDSLRKELANEGISNVVVVPNVINTSRFQVNGNIPAGLKIGFLGSLNTHNKGLDLLLMACSGLPVDFSLKIGGGGTNIDHYREMAEKLGISGKCNFTGEMPVTEIPGFYSGLNLFVLPSRYETFGIVLVEAMASGLPVISTRCGGPEEIVNEKTGLLADTDNSDQLREAIIKVYSNSGSYDPQEIHKFAENNWGANSFLNKINPIYQRCL